MTELTEAIERHDAAEVKRLLFDVKVDPNEPKYAPPGKMPYTIPPFIIAAKEGGVEIGRMLKQAGADTHAKNSFHNDAMTIAMEYPVFVAFLIDECGFEPNRIREKRFGGTTDFITECCTSLTAGIVQTIRLLVDKYGVLPDADCIRWVESELRGNDPKGEGTKKHLEVIAAPEQREQILRARQELHNYGKEVLSIFEAATKRKAASDTSGLAEKKVPLEPKPATLKGTKKVCS